MNQGIPAGNNLGLLTAVESTTASNHATLSNFSLLGSSSNWVSHSTESANPAPIITSFSPASGAVGSSVVISGNNFNTTPANNIVYFGSTRATVTASSTTSITATVPSGASFQPITVMNTSYALMGASQQSFDVKYAGGVLAYTATTDIASINVPKVLTYGDLDNDGRTDLVYTNYSVNSVSVVQNASTSGVISLSAPQVITCGNNPFGVALGDLDGDGKKDMVVANAGSNTLSVYRNTSITGTISFAAPITYNTGFSPRGLTIGDLDGDGKPEIIATTSSSYSLDIFKNQSTIGALAFAAKQSLAVNNPESVIVADLDGDGKQDLAATNGNNNGVTAFLNTSSGSTISFGAAAHFAAGDYTLALVPADIDGDGKLDLAVANRGSSTMSILRNTSSVGALSFAIQQSFTTGSTPFWLNVSDINGDGKTDIVTANQDGNSVSVLLNKSTPGVLSINAKTDYSVGTTPVSVVATDMDGDAKPDIMSANVGGSSISYLRNTQAILPVSGLALAANKKGTGIILNWSTLGESNTNVFDVEKSSDGITFTKIGTVKAAGSSSQKSNYLFEDGRPYAGANYYRLALVDDDANRKFSAVIIIRWQDASELTITLAPQPVISTMNVSINGNSHKGDFIIFNASGRMLKRYPVTAGTSSFQVDRSGMPSGIYFYKFVTETGEIKGSGKIIAN